MTEATGRRRLREWDYKEQPEAAAAAPPTNAKKFLARADGGGLFDDLMDVLGF